MTNASVPRLPNTVQAIIIGAGQAGLAAAHELQRRGLSAGKDFLILDANDGPGGAWRHRWDSLTLGVAHGIADLPGLDLTTAVPDHQAQIERQASEIVAAYYSAYEARFDLHVVRPAKVVAVQESTTTTNDGTGLLEVTALVDGQCQCLTTRAVLSATGTWDSPFVPYIPGIEDFAGRQLHTAQFTNAAEFADKKTLVVGGGLSAVQFLLQLQQVTDTVWATRRPPNFSEKIFDQTWGVAVEQAVRQRTAHGQRPASVVHTTGIPQTPEYLAGVRDGTLVSRGMFDRIGEHSVRFGAHLSDSSGHTDTGTTTDQLALPESWQPFPADHWEDVDVIFWNTGFRHSLNHLSPLRLIERSAAANSPTQGLASSSKKNRHAGITMIDEVRVAGEPRVFLVGYGSAASTIGATRAGRRAAQASAAFLA